MPNISLKTALLLLVTITLWSSAFVGIREGLVGYSPGALALLRYGIASICMIFIYKKAARKDVIAGKDKILLLMVGAIGIGLYNITLNYAEISVTSSTTSFIVNQGPILSSVFAILFLGEKGTVLGFLGMFVSIFGVFLISIGEAHGVHWQLGIGYVFLATLVGSLYSILQKPFLKKYYAIDVTAYVIWGSTLSLFMYAPATVHELFKAPIIPTLAVIYLGIFPAAIAYASWSYVLRDIPTSLAVSFLYISPIITTILGWLFLSEVPAKISLIGGLIAMIGVWAVNYAYRVKKFA